jgi:hypothetical protein
MAIIPKHVILGPMCALSKILLGPVFPFPEEKEVIAWAKHRSDFGAYFAGPKYFGPLIVLLFFLGIYLLI